MLTPSLPRQDFLKSSILKTTMLCGLIAAPFMVAPTALAGSVDDPWLVRVRGLSVMPDEAGTTVPLGGTVSIENQIVPELDISYFFTENFAVEAIFAVTPHDVSVENSLLGDVDLGDVWLLPPTVTAQYHFNPRGKVRPYVGAGINYTAFFNADSGPVANTIEYSDEFGWALNAGVDIPVNDIWFANIDVKKLFLETDVVANAGGLIVTSDVQIDPWIVGVGFGRRF
ncbi:outer membrane protein [Algimonas porphyrae]|uniref:Outer membrane protein n=2 Tax=Algimonas porphyrae TaxID=1128113 RepID=A0ABQ5V0T6_9PROT|nr:outer membrane protein [Algimonas porphyrae]